MDLKHKLLNESKLTETEKQSILKEEQIIIPPRPSFNKREPIAPEPIENKTFDESLLSEPSMPEYKKPGLFNKNKVIKENERIKEDYEHRMSLHKKTLTDFMKYQEEKQRYEDSLLHYKQEKTTYDKEYSEYENKLTQFLEIKKRLQETYELYEKKKAQDLLKKHQKELESIDLRIESCDKISQQDFLESSKDYKEYCLKYNFYKEEITEASKALFEIRDLKEALLALNIIYFKYTGLPALSTIYDYFESGRVTELTGPFGAYNLYESELRSSLILEKLDTIIDSLDSIKNNQYSLYTIMNQVNDNVIKMDKALNSINFQMASISNITNKMGNLFDQKAKQRMQEAYAATPTFSAYYQNKETTQTHITGNKKRASVILRGALGGVLAGPVGAIIGGMSAIDKNLQ